MSAQLPYAASCSTSLPLTSLVSLALSFEHSNNTKLNPVNDGWVAPSAALLRKQSTAIDRLLTQNFGISLLHIRLEGDSALAMPSAGPSASGSAALTKRTRDSSSSEPDLFPSVASQSPASAQNGDASVFLNSADGQKAVRRMSNIFVQKLLGQSATKATEQAVQGRWIVPSSPPTMPPTTDDGDEEEEEEQDEEENIEQEEHEQNVDAESFSLAECEERREWVGENPFTWCRCGKCVSAHIPLLDEPSSTETLPALEAQRFALRSFRLGVSTGALHHQILHGQQRHAKKWRG